MKRLSLSYVIATLALFGLGFMSGCGDDTETPAPTISLVNPPSQSALSGSKVSFSVKTSAPEKIESISIIKKIGTTSSTITTKTSGFQSNTDDLFVYDYDVVETSGTVELTFKVVDKKGKEGSTSFTINVKGIKSILAIVLNAQLSVATDAGSFYATKTATKGTSSTSAAADVDITYAVIGSGNTSSFVSPDARTANGLTSQQTGATKTTFGTSGLDFATVTVDQLNSASDPTGSTVTVTNGSTYIFKNAAGGKGLIKVTSLTTGTAGAVTFDIKVLQ